MILIVFIKQYESDWVISWHDLLSQTPPGEMLDGWWRQKNIHCVKVPSEKYTTWCRHPTFIIDFGDILLCFWGPWGSLPNEKYTTWCRHLTFIIGFSNIRLSFRGPRGSILWSFRRLNEAQKPRGDQGGDAWAILGSHVGPGLDFERFWSTFGPHFGKSISKSFVKQLILGLVFFWFCCSIFPGEIFFAFASMVWSPQT